ncbi:MAG: hypothetical protein O3C40_26315 [Planctomycetota bacterium]|nr:hypothetical protein [Planctomycetota bacterium]
MRFDGEPYDGRELPIQPPFAKMMRLPRERDLDAFLGSADDDPGVTGLQSWPYLYELDETVNPVAYRFKQG